MSFIDPLNPLIFVTWLLLCRSIICMKGSKVSGSLKSPAARRNLSSVLKYSFVYPISCEPKSIGVIKWLPIVNNNYSSSLVPKCKLWLYLVFPSGTYLLYCWKRNLYHAKGCRKSSRSVSVVICRYCCFFLNLYILKRSKCYWFAVMYYGNRLRQ